MGVQRIPNGSVHYASGTLETLCTGSRIEVVQRKGERLSKRESLGCNRRGVCKLVDQVNVQGLILDTTKLERRLVK